MNDKTVTVLLQRLRDGNKQAADELIPLVYDHMRKLAAKLVRGERRDHTLQATAVVNECYMDLVDMSVDWKDRAHFFAIATRQMRRILVDYARARNSQKRGGNIGAQSLDDTLTEPVIVAAELGADILDLDTALTRLASFDERKCSIVEMHYFGGLTYDEIGAALELSAATVDRELRLGKAWLYKELSDSVSA